MSDGTSPYAADDIAITGADRSDPEIREQQAPETGETPHSRPTHINRHIRLKGIAIGLVLPLIGLGLWEIAGRNEWLAGGLFPPFSDALVGLWDFIFGGSEPQNTYSGEWAANLGASAGRILAGYAIGGAIAVLLGLGSGFFVTVRRAIDPLINVLRPISITAWIPLTLIIFGVGNKPAVFLTALATFYPVYIDTFLGTLYVDNSLVRAAKMLGATRWKVLKRVTLPATLPSIASGLRVALALAWTTVVVAEMLGAKSGIGYVLIDSYKQFGFDYVIACMITLGFVGFLSDKLLAVAFTRPLRWAHMKSKE